MVDTLVVVVVVVTTMFPQERVELAEVGVILVLGW
jgi:hypothetical protein